MRVFISGVCGFVGSELALGLREQGHEVSGCDNFSRPGSELNRTRIESAGVDFRPGDVRRESDLEHVRGVDWLIDAAANPSVLAGVDGKTSSRELLEHNLWGTVNLLEVCKRENAGMILLSTSRVYSIPALCALPVEPEKGAFVLRQESATAGRRGLNERFSTAAPISLYGATKLASEQLALEYGAAFGFPDFGIGEDPLDEALAIGPEGLLDPPDVDHVIADADDHLRPRLPGLMAGVAASSGGSLSAS